MLAVRGRGNVAIPLAFTGIAASLLIGGPTVHSGFKLGLSVDETTVCNLRCVTAYAKYLVSAKIIIIDKASICVHVI